MQVKKEEKIKKNIVEISQKNYSGLLKSTDFW